jgi:hypothetical protein
MLVEGTFGGHGAVVRRSGKSALLLAPVALLALASPASGKGPVSHERPPSETKRAILDYWTAERIRRAEPRDLERDLPVAPDDQQASSSGRRPHFVPPAGPGVDRPGATPHPPSAPQIFGSYKVLDYDVRPNTVHGKVFFTNRGGDWKCSATAVNSTNLSVVFTAAHCIQSPRFGWTRDLIFIPAYFHRKQPFGAWVGESFWTPSRWLRRVWKNYKSVNFNFDFAAVVLAPQNGVPVVEAVGGAGFAWNEPRGVRPFRRFGYPSNYFKGERLMACFSPPRRGPDGDRGPGMVGMTCDMGKGSSGGGWLIEDEFLNSVTSIGLGDFAAGPYFGRAAARLLARAELE